MEPHHFLILEPHRNYLETAPAPNPLAYFVYKIYDQILSLFLVIDWHKT
jgi:hypothetical protein